MQRSLTPENLLKSFREISSQEELERFALENEEKIASFNKELLQKLSPTQRDKLESFKKKMQEVVETNPEEFLKFLREEVKKL